MSGLNGSLSPVPTMSGGLSTGITTDYNNLQNLPLVNGSVLEGGENINLIPQTVGAIRYASILGLNRGALVFYDNELYMNTSGASTMGGAFDPSKWTQIIISELFVNNLNNILGGYYTNQWKNSGSYVLEDIVIYNGLIYVCIVDNATTGTFVNNEWTQISVYNMMDKKIDEVKTSTQVTGTASGSIATFDDGSANPIIELTANIEAVQSGSGDPSPSNIRPISGWDGANVWVQAEVDPTAEADYSISWQTQCGTVYGGNAKVFKDGGKWYCTVTATHKKLSLSQSEATYNSGWNCWVLQSISDSKVVSDNNTPPNVIGDRYKAIKASGYTTSHSIGTITQNTSGYWFFDNGSTTTCDGEIIYELATPTTTTFEISTEIATLLGDNNIFADCGDIEECRYVTGVL